MARKLSPWFNHSMLQTQKGTPEVAITQSIVTCCSTRNAPPTARGPFLQLSAVMWLFPVDGWTPSIGPLSKRELHGRTPFLCRSVLGHRARGLVTNTISLQVPDFPYTPHASLVPGFRFPGFVFFLAMRSTGACKGRAREGVTMMSP